MAHSIENSSSKIPHHRYIVEGLSKNDEARLTPVLLRLHGDGASRGNMLAECNAILAKSITAAQLDGVRTKLGMHTYRRRHSRGGPPIQNQALTTVTSNGENVETTNRTLESHLVQNNAATVYSQNPSVGSNHSLHEEQEDQYAGGSDSLEEVDLAQTTMNGSSEVTNQCTAPQLNTIGVSRVMNTSPLTNNKTPTASLALPQHESDGHQQLHNTNVAVSTPDTCGAIMPAKYRVTLGSINFGMDLYQSSHVVYDPSPTILRFYQASLAGRMGLPRTARLVRVATLLHILRAFDDAFDLFYILYNSICETQTLEDPLHPLLVFAAISCARSAQSKLQFQVVHGMISHVRTLAMPLPSMPNRVLHFLSKFERRLEYINGDTFTPMFPEDIIDAALWTLAPLALTEGKEITTPWPRSWSTGVAISSAVDQALRFIQSGDAPQQTIRHGLAYVFSHIEEHAREIDHIMDVFWLSFSSDAASSTAQALSYSVLREYPSKLTKTGLSLEGIQFSETYDFIGSFHALAIAVIPFALMSWRGQAMFDLRKTLKQLQLGDYPSTSSSFSFVNLCFAHMAAPAKQRHSTSDRFSADKLVAIYRAVVLGTIAYEVPVQDLRQEPPRSYIGHEHRTQAERQSLQSSILLPTLAEPYRGSTSSSLRSFLSTAARARNGNQRISDSRENTISDPRTSNSSWKLSFMSLTSSGRLASQQSVRTISSDVEMTG